MPNKNFRKVNDLPLYKHVLYKLSKFDVYVDTDSNEVINASNHDPLLSHVTAYHRTESLKGNEVSVIKLINDFIDRFSIQDDEIICQVHVTSPFINPETLSAAYNKLQSGYDSIVSCNVLQTRLWRKESYGVCPINHNPMKLEQTQDLPLYFEENSLFYMFQAGLVKSLGNRVGHNPMFYETNYPENFDIDTEEDWAIFIDMVKNNV